MQPGLGTDARRAKDPRGRLCLPATAWTMRGEDAKALADGENAVRLNPTFAPYYVVRGLSHARLGHYAAAEADLLQSLRIDPKGTAAMNNLAWLWATCPDPQFRHGDRAVQCATDACEATAWKEPTHLGTLAAALAEAGDFDTAITMQQKALENPAYQRQEGEKAHERIRLYQAGNLTGRGREGKGLSKNRFVGWTLVRPGGRKFNPADETAEPFLDRP